MQNKENKTKTKSETKNNVLLIVLTIALVIPLCVVAVQMTKIAVVYDEILGRQYNRGNSENIIKMATEIDSMYEKYYIGEAITDEEAEDGMLKGLEWAYDDPYGVYRTPEETKEFEANQNELLLGGIGIQTMYENNMEKYEDYRYSYYVTHVYDESPAKKSGIQKGDRVVQVDDTVLTANNSDTFLDSVKGEKGTEVTVTVLRESQTNKIEKLNITITRGDIQNNSIFTEIIDNNIGYIVINTFSNKTDEEFEEALKMFKSKGIEKYIIDVRNNGGGSADTVIRMLDTLLPEGLIAEMKYKDEKDNTEYMSDSSETEGEFICLINKRSISASELFAKALKDYGKATLVGELTYGKGTVVGTKMLSNGGSITLSIGEYITKSGDTIEEKGVEPDIEVIIPPSVDYYLYKLPRQSDTQLMKAIELLQ